MSTSTALQTLRDEQLTMIGGSSLHHVFSLPPYGCERQLVLKLRGTQEDHAFHGNKATERGTRLEDFAAEVFAEETELQVRRVAGGLSGKAKRHPDFPYIAVHADREIVDVAPGTVFDPQGNCVNPEGGPGILSIKVPGEMAFRKMANQGLPAQYVMQLQYELFVWNRTWGSYCLFWADGWQVRWFNFRRDDEMIKYIVDGVHNTWRKVENGPLPEKLEATDPRCARCPFRTQCQGEELLKLINKDVEEGEVIPYVPDLDLVRMCDELARQNQLADELEEFINRIKADIKAKIGDNRATDVDGWRIWNRLQAGRQTVQRDPLKKYLRDVAEMSNKVAAALLVMDMQDSADMAELKKLHGQLLTVLTTVSELPATFEKKYVNVGKPFRVFAVNPK